MDTSIYTFDNTDGLTENNEFYSVKPKMSKRQSNRRRNNTMSQSQDNTKPLYQVNKKISENIKKGKKGQIVLISDDGWETVESKKLMKK